MVWFIKKHKYAGRTAQRGVRLSVVRELSVVLVDRGEDLRQTRAV